MKQHIVWAGLALMATTAACGGRPKSAADIERNRLLEAAPAAGNFDSGVYVDIDRVRTTTPYKAFVEWSKTANDPSLAELTRFETTCKKSLGEFFHQVAVFHKGDDAFLIARVAVPDAAAKACFDAMKDPSPKHEKSKFETYDLSNGLVRAGSPALIQASKSGGAISPIAHALELDGDRVIAIRGVKDGRTMEAFLTASPTAIGIDGNVEFASEREADETARSVPMLMALMGKQKELSIDASSHGKFVEFTDRLEADETKQTEMMTKVLAKMPPATALPNATANPPIASGQLSKLIDETPSLGGPRLGTHIAKKPAEMKPIVQASDGPNDTSLEVTKDRRVFGTEVTSLVYTYEEKRLEQVVAQVRGAEQCLAIRTSLSTRFNAPTRVKVSEYGDAGRLDWTGTKAELSLLIAGDGCSVSLHRLQGAETPKATQTRRGT